MLRVDLGVFAHDEAAGIAAMVAGLRAQVPPPGVDLRLLVLANGCRDDTVARARAAGAEVADLPQGGKSRTWNRFVHDLSRPEADLLVFCDADICLPEPDALARLITALAARPAPARGPLLVLVLARADRRSVLPAASIVARPVLLSAGDEDRILPTLVLVALGVWSIVP